MGKVFYWMLLVIFVSPHGLNADDLQKRAKTYLESFDFCAVCDLVPSVKDDQDRDTAKYRISTLFFGKEKAMKGRLSEIVQGLDNPGYGRDYLVLARYHGNPKNQGKVAFRRIPIEGKGLRIDPFARGDESLVEWDVVWAMLGELRHKKGQ